MRTESLEIASRWEQQLGDPRQADALLNFDEALREDEAEAFPQARLNTLLRLGMFEQLLPARLDGQMEEPERILALSRILSRRDLSTAIAFGQTLLGSIPIWLAGSPSQQQAHAQSLRAGSLACLALTEREHGSDILSTEFKVQADPDGIHLRLSGEKWLINNGSKGGSATVLACQQHVDGRKELVLLRLARGPAEGSGWRSLAKIQTHGIRGADISGFRLQDYPCVAADAAFPRTEAALSTVLKTLQISRILCAGFSLGATDTLLRLTLGFAQQRQLYGKTVAQIPVARAKLAQCYAKLLCNDLLAQAATRSIALLPGELSVLSPICKYQLPVSCEAIARELAQVLGARHYLRSQDELGMFQKMARDLQVVSLFDGSTQVNLGLLAGQLRQLQQSLNETWAEGSSDAARLMNQARQLLTTSAAVKGWPESSALRLSSQGRDSLMQAYLCWRRGTQGVSSDAVAVALLALDQGLQQCLANIEQHFWVNRLPVDSSAAQQLAMDYARLWPGCALALAWCFDQEAAAITDRTGVSSDLLLEGLRQTLPELGIAACEAREQRLLQAAMNCVEQHLLFSLSPLQAAW
ncbi:acyl-CoA dehydrogenase [Paucibacter sp. DJ1R-11]|uniref:acyl-CoA dehydrogenase n=1 Tax=Paucibacter sp. DJ1R-11 TaxID=2893556 RepID=UPI0021E516B7|nr:acyl-CoA dehydrogenase [Paucibacter sp. DJ1R-11]MCV2366054.1 acyl-CoA dehydrogenase [Paucibacter sp. DJ1R-11]